MNIPDDMVSRIISTLFKIPILAFFLLTLAPTYVLAAQINVVSNMNFGMIEFAPTHQGTLALGSNGSVTLNSSGLSYLGGGVAGQVNIIGDSGVVEIRCSATSTLEGTDGGSLDVINIEASVGSGVSSGAGTACAGVVSSGPDPIIIDLSASPNPSIYFGGTLDIPPNGITKSQNYDANGAPLGISAIFQ